MIARADAKSHHVNRKENILAAKHQANKASNEEKFTDWKQSQLHSERREQERAVAENKIKEAKLKAIRDKKEDGSDGGSSQGKGGRGGDMSCVGMSTPSARYLLPCTVSQVRWDEDGYVADWRTCVVLLAGPAPD